MAVLSSLSHAHLLAQAQAKPCAFLSLSSPHSSSSLSSFQDSHLKLPTITHHPSPHSGLSSRRSCSRPGIAIYAAVTQRSLHDFSVKDIDGKNVDLSTYKGKVLLIVNVASRCGLTASNYTELAKLYSNFKGRDFEILAFPCNQFGGQEPGSNRQIKEFACSRFKSEFPIFDKVDVNGPNEAPVYKFLKSNKPGGLIEGLLGDGIKWNFEKFLVDKKGRVFERYPPTTSPLQIEGDIKKLLAT